MTTSAIDFIDDEHRALFSKICDEEEKVTKELQAATARHPLLDAKVRNVTKVLPNLELISNDAKQLCDMIGFASTLIENVSFKVRRLDIARLGTYGSRLLQYHRFKYEDASEDDADDSDCSRLELGDN